MNEPRFKMFILYMIDLHNLHIEDRVDLAANPINEKREEYVKIQIGNSVAKVKTVEKDDFEVADKKLEEVMSAMIITEPTEEEKFEDCFTVDSTGELRCNFCPANYRKEGHLRNHMDSKHNKSFKTVCSCGKSFPDSTRLSRHKKTCK